jgi:histone H3/H4
MNSTISKVLKQVHPDLRINEQAKEVISVMINNVLSAIVNLSPSMSLDDLTNTVKNLLPGELAKHALSTANKDLVKYSRSEGQLHGLKNVTKIVLLQLSPVTVKKIIKNMGADVKDAPVESFIFLASALEYLIAELLEIGGNAARDNRKGTIGKWHIELVLLNDEELIELFNRVGNPLAEHWRTPAQYPKMSKYQMRKDLEKLGIKVELPYPTRVKTFNMYPDKDNYPKKQCKGAEKDPSVYVCNPRTGKYLKKNSYDAHFI